MDERALSFINLHAVLGALSALCALDEEAGELIQGKNISIGFSVKGGPEGTLIFRDGTCSFAEGCGHCDVKLPFSSPEKFNGLINGTTTPIPSKGFTKIGFLLKQFTKLTELLSTYLQPTDEQLADPGFFERSTRIMFYVIVEALAQVGNEDSIGRFSAGNTVDGIVKIGIENSDYAYIDVRDHHLTAYHTAPQTCMSYMIFEDIRTARDLFDGKINAIVATATGRIRLGGMILQVDNINRMLDRVALYLS